MITISDGSLGTFNKQCLSPDLIKGYRWIDEDIRMLKIVNGNSVYDRIFRPNNAGYVSGKDYNFKKEDNIYRFIVLGDSYTAAEYIDSPWPDKIEMTINKPDDSLKYEFYSFALDAAGITNWHSIFFNEIVLQYEFDALILAVYDDDLYRNFYMMYTDKENIYGSYLDNKPADMITFDNTIKKDMYIVGKILNDSIIDKNLKRKNYSTFQGLVKNNLYLLSSFHTQLLKIEYNIRTRRNSNQVYAKSNASDFKTIKRNIGRDKLDMLDDILQYCIKNNKAVLLSSIPHIEIVKQNNYTLTKSETQLELECISNHYSIPYFDAYPYFQQLAYDSLESFYLKHDGHWNQRGSDYFAWLLARYIRDGFIF